MGFVSGNGMFEGPSAQKTESQDGQEDRDMDELGGRVEAITRKVAEAVFQGNPI